MGKIVEVISWLITGSLIVLVITHPNGFSRDVSAIGSTGTGVMTVLTGQNQPGQG